jgi:hypothetical protein
MKTKLEDYTPMEIAKYREMDKELTEYNLKLGSDDEIAAPNYSDEEKAELSRYFEIVLEAKAKSSSN